MEKGLYNHLRRILASLLVVPAFIGVATAQTPDNTPFKSIATSQIALPVSAGQPGAAIRITLASPAGTGLATAGGPGNQEPLTLASAGFNGVRPFGGAPITFDAQFGFDPASMPASGSTLNPVNANEAWKALVGYQWRALSIKAGINQFYAGFTSPLSLDRFNSDQDTLGGTELDSSYSITPSLVLMAGGQFYDGRSNSGQQVLLGANDHMNQANVGVSYGISSKSSLALGYEWVQWDLNNSQGALNAPGKPTEQYITVGLGQSVSKNAAFKLLYQVEDYKDDGTGFSSANLPNNGSGAVIGQATIKF